MDRDEVIRLRTRALAAHAENPYTVVTAIFLVKVLDALLGEVQERDAVPTPPPRPLGPLFGGDR